MKIETKYCRSISEIYTKNWLYIARLVITDSVRPILSYKSNNTTIVYPIIRAFSALTFNFLALVNKVIAGGDEGIKRFLCFSFFVCFPNTAEILWNNQLTYITPKDRTIFLSFRSTSHITLRKDADKWKDYPKIINVLYFVTYIHTCPDGALGSAYNLIIWNARYYMFIKFVNQTKWLDRTKWNEIIFSRTYSYKFIYGF